MPDEYAHQRSELLKEKAALEELLRDSGNRVEQWLKSAEDIFTFASTARERFANGDAAVKNRFLLRSERTASDAEKLSTEAKEPFLILGKSLCPHKVKTNPIEPQKKAQRKG